VFHAALSTICHAIIAHPVRLKNLRLAPMP
jgi:hypothetical protein